VGGQRRHGPRRQRLAAAGALHERRGHVHEGLELRPALGGGEAMQQQRGVHVDGEGVVQIVVESHLMID